MARLGRSGRLIALFGLLSLATVVTGALVCASSGVAASSWLRNLAAWGVGALAAALIAWRMRPAWLPVALWTAPAGLAATLVSADQDGVRRWVDLGPVHMNVAMTLLPAATVALAASAPARRWAWIPAFLALGLLVLQPDASQALALALPMALIAAFVVPKVGARLALIAAAGLLAALAWSRPDPLQPVAEVEQIVSLAFKLSPLVGGASLLLLLAVAALPALATRACPPGPRLAGRALSLCLLLWAVAPLLGAFPVPFAGVGMSPIVGAWLGVGVLAGLLRVREVRPVP